MKRIELRTGAVVASILLCGVVASPARAQSESEAIAAARALGVEGLRLADAGNCVEAEDKLAKAEKLHHAVTTQVRLGECQISRGKLVDGTENLQKVVRETLPANAPAALVTAQERARKLLDDTKPKIGRSKITVKGLAEGATPKVVVDGAVLNNVMLDTDHPTDPGEHKVDVTAEGYLASTASFTLKEGASETVTITMQKDPSYHPPPPPVVATQPQQQTAQPTQPAQPPAAAEPPKRNWVPVIAAGGIGVVGLGVWTGFGLAAMGQKSDLDSACKNQVCPDSAKDKLDSAKTNATIASIGLGVGAAGVVTAVVLYFVTTPKAEGSASASTATITPLVGPTSVGLSGSF